MTENITTNKTLKEHGLLRQVVMEGIKTISGM